MSAIKNDALVPLLIPLEGGEHGHIHIAFLVPMFSLGNAET